jgi:DMSO/TMAO reductase YedYZ molybdopterin-dependent catalytic subunit
MGKAFYSHGAMGERLAKNDTVIDTRTSAVRRVVSRRRLVMGAAAGATCSVLGGEYVFAAAPDPSERRPDGRRRLPPGQRVLRQLRPMGGTEGDPSRSAWRLRVHGEVSNPFEIDFRELLAMPQEELSLDVHCVTGWSVLGANWRGVALSRLAARAGLKKGVRHVIFEAAHGYTCNVPVAEALAPGVMVAHRLDNRSLSVTNGAPVRGLVPDLYFWKSAKWLTGVRFQRRDAPGYWEVRGYHNHADPWTEERYG